MSIVLYSWSQWLLQLCFGMNICHSPHEQPWHEEYSRAQQGANCRHLCCVSEDLIETNLIFSVRLSIVKLPKIRVAFVSKFFVTSLSRTVQCYFSNVLLGETVFGSRLLQVTKTALICIY